MRPRQAGDAVLDDSPDSATSTSAAATYRASAWVLAPAGHVVTLRVRERNGGGAIVRSSLASATASGGWQQLALTATAKAGGSALGVEVLASLARGSKAQVDDLSLQRG